MRGLTHWPKNLGLRAGALLGVPSVTFEPKRWRRPRDVRANWIPDLGNVHVCYFLRPVPRGAANTILLIGYPLPCLVLA